MQARGLLSRKPCPSDARSFWIELTKKGQALADRAIPMQLAEVERLFIDALAKEQMQALVGIADAIERHLIEIANR